MTQETSYTGIDFLNFRLLWVFYGPCHHVPHNHHTETGESYFYFTDRTPIGIKHKNPAEQGQTLW